MRKQYRTVEMDWYRSHLYLYHDGEEVSVNVYNLHEIYDEIEGLESHGYTRGYTKEEIRKAKEEYELRSANAISVSSFVPRCDKCVNGKICPRHLDDENKCPKYKKDPPDGGSY